MPSNVAGPLPPPGGRPLVAWYRSRRRRRASHFPVGRARGVRPSPPTSASLHDQGRSSVERLDAGGQPARCRGWLRAAGGEPLREDTAHLAPSHTRHEEEPRGPRRRGGRARGPHLVGLDAAVAAPRPVAPWLGRRQIRRTRTPAAAVRCVPPPGRAACPAGRPAGMVVDSRTAPSWGRRTRHHPDRPMPAAVWSGRRASDRRGRTR